MEEMKIRKVSDGYLGILDLPGQPAQVGKRKLRRDLERWRKETIVRWALTCKPEDLIAYLGKTQLKLAADLGIEQSTLSKWKLGKRKMSRPVRMALLRLLGL